MRVADFPIEENIIRQRLSTRGGGIEIDVSPLGKKYEGVRMTAYQNYLGDGMLGSIQGDCNLPGWTSNRRLVNLNNRLKRYMHELTRHEDDEWEDASFEEGQQRPTSAY